MSRQRIKIEAGERTFIVRGWRVRDISTEAGVKVIYAGSVNGWIGDIGRLGEVLAHLDHRHLRYELTGVSRGQLSTAVESSETAQRVEQSEQLDLLDGTGDGR